MKDPLGVSPSKGNQGTTRGKEKNSFDLGGNQGLVGIESTTSGLDLPLLCRLPPRSKEFFLYLVWFPGEGPPGFLDVGAPSLPSSFKTSGCSTLSTGANFRSPRWPWTAVLYMFRGRVPALYLVVSCRTHLMRFRHYGRNRRNRG